MLVVLSAFAVVAVLVISYCLIRYILHCCDQADRWLKESDAFELIKGLAKERMKLVCDREMDGSFSVSILFFVQPRVPWGNHILPVETSIELVTFSDGGLLELNDAICESLQGLGCELQGTWDGVVGLFAPLLSRPDAEFAELLLYGKICGEKILLKPDKAITLLKLRGRPLPYAAHR